MTATPRVSVVVPVFNGERYLRAALESVLAQTVPPDELLVFDNASTDQSVAIATELVGPSNVFISDRNLGAIANFNKAAQSAEGDLVMWLAADDLLDRQFLQIAAARLEANPKASVCVTGIQFIGPHGEPLRRTSEDLLADPAAHVRLRAFLRRSRWTEFYGLYRREALRAGPPLRPEWGADVMFTWWFLLRDPLEVVPDALMFYREYPNKPPEVTAETIDPSAKPENWRNLRLWMRLWSMTRDPDLPASSGRVGRRELILCWAHGSWWRHLVRDAGVRWPLFGRPLRAADRWIRRVRKLDGGYA